ncbi:hypothetical protein [Seonamhaeicola maritimus]|uniref:Uncharacterized protein n=1 Tax=Seonamhaeicola maritimus TaxID=2591822 RepID=A0A5C7GKA8_9FLAO|nr:hypothetical protein [Seonamhaeicola maritimus]TXG38722.1 hypothetical protein FUA22_02215 [Seonamhaeicola maritimus]
MSGNALYDPRADQTYIPPYDITNSLWEQPIPETYNKEFIQLAFIWSHRVRVRKANKMTLDELKNTGQYSLINRTIKQELISYYKEWDNYYKDIVIDLGEKWQISLGREGLLNSETYKLEEPLSLLKYNTIRINLFKRMIREAEWQLKGIPKLKEKNNDLITALKDEIELL